VRDIGARDLGEVAAAQADRGASQIRR